MGTASTPIHLRVLDVRPILAAQRHPIDDVMAAVDALAPDGVLEILAPFEPVPLMQKLRARQCGVESLLTAPDTWVVRVGKGALPPLEDLTALEAPEPLERVLRACALLPSGGVYTAWLPRRPVMLFPQLQARGLVFATHDHPDATAVLWVKRV